MDYDIDKLYILAFSVNPNGLVQTGKSLQSKYGLDFVSKLVRPEGKEIINAGENASLIISQEDVLHYMRGDFSEDELANLYNMILKSDGKIAFEVGPHADTKSMTDIERAEYWRMRDRYHYTTEQILNEVNSYSKSVLTSDSDPNYLKNRVVSTIFDITTKLQNQLIAQVPVDMGDPKKAAEASTLGKAELHINSDNPATKFMMQMQNMIGKKVIGISAVSLKAFFGLSYYYAELTDDVKKACEGLGNTTTEIDVINAIGRLVFQHPITGELTSLANIDIEQVLDVIKGDDRFRKIALDPNIEYKVKAEKSCFNANTNTFDLIKFCKLLRERVNLTDAALTDSAVISAAKLLAGQVAILDTNLGKIGKI